MEIEVDGNIFRKLGCNKIVRHPGILNVIFNNCNSSNLLVKELEYII